MSLDGDDLTEDEYLSLLDIRERFDGRRRAMHNGEAIFKPDDFSLALNRMHLTKPLYREYADGKTFEIVSRYSPCVGAIRGGTSHTQSLSRDSFCEACRKSLTDDEYA